MFLITLSLFVATVGLIYLYLIWNFDYWKKRNVNGPKPRPFVGTYPSILKHNQHMVYDLQAVYNEFKAKNRFAGLFSVCSPQLLLLDPKLIQTILTTDFKYFHDNEIAVMFDPKKDPLFANNPFLSVGEAWREQRQLVSPGMTSGRIKTAYTVMQNVCKKFCEYIDKECTINAPKDGINGKDLALRFTAENVFDCVLGIQAHSFTENPVPVPENVKRLLDFSVPLFIYTIIMGFFPKIVNLYKLKFVPNDCDKFFFDILKESFQLRMASNIDRQDFLSHLLHMKEKKNLNLDELASHSMTFLIDGLETTATTIACCLLYLARDPVCQAKLRKEIEENLDEDGELSYDKLNELPYLDACIHETLRLLPPALFSSKRCTLPYTLTTSNGKILNINVGDVVMLPIHAIHHDAQYYPEPEKFNPERFMPENGGLKKYREMGVFLGFSDGPRMCLGMRFALVQTKAAISSIVKNFQIINNPKTKEGNNLDPKQFLANFDGGVWLNFEKLH